VEDYYKTRAKVESMGWVPGRGPTSPEASQNPQHPHRIIASALMKRAMADIQNVMTIQKESAGMSKLYSRSMCSVKQWKSYQMAEQVISQEIADVKAEADDIEPGWSHSIWQQASQYQAMLKKKHEMELQAAQEKAKAVKAAETKPATAAAASASASSNTSSKKAEKEVVEDDPKARELAAQKAAEELLREEEEAKKKKGGKPFSGGGVKKGFLEGGKGGKKK
jgi:Preprotein translocase subunit Sec66